MLRIILLVFATFMLHACAGTMTEQECQQANWYALGRKDGNQGRQYQLFKDYFASCASKQIVANERQYYEGYLEGMTYFCTYETGFKRGKKNGRPHSACPEESDYLLGYLNGQVVYEVEEDQRLLKQLARDFEVRRMRSTR